MHRRLEASAYSRLCMTVRGSVGRFCRNEKALIDFSGLVFRSGQNKLRIHAAHQSHISRAAGRRCGDGPEGKCALWGCRRSAGDSSGLPSLARVLQCHINMLPCQAMPAGQCLNAKQVACSPITIFDPIILCFMMETILFKLRLVFSLQTAPGRKPSGTGKKEAALQLICCQDAA